MSNSDASDNVWDLRGLRCPLPVLKARNRMRKLAEGEQIWVVTDDPMALIDIPHFANEYGQGLDNLLVDSLTAYSPDTTEYLNERK